jgi:hypothetical protein
MAETEPFTIVESEASLTLLKLCLKCNRDNVFIPKADAFRNGVVKRTDALKEILTGTASATTDNVSNNDTLVIALENRLHL